MGAVLDSITAYKDSLTGGAFEALTIADGDTFSVRSFGPGTRAKLLEAWGGNNATKCDFSVRSPLLHDASRGLRFAHMFNPTLSGADGNPQVYLPAYLSQAYVPTDVLTVEVNGTASDDVTFTQLVHYEGPEVPAARLRTWQEIESRIRNLVGIRVSPSPHATTSTWGTAEALSADDDRLKANTDYALLGFTTDLPYTTLAIDGPDTANMRIAMPGHWDARLTSGWFMEMSRRLQLPLVPVINANNKGSTNVRAATAGGGGSPLSSLLFAELD